MGYAYYDTPLGPAGYSVDRGLGALCGNTPGRKDEYGCGLWFCEEHLMAPVDGCFNGTCGACWQRANETELDGAREDGE